MGRKTRKEKIITDLRKKVSMMEGNHSSKSFKPDSLPPKESNSKQETVSLPKISSTPTPSQSASIYVYPTQLIKKDLTRTILLSILAISLEVILFLASKGKIRLPVINWSLPVNLRIR